MPERGRLLTLEGIDGCGKTTVAAALVRRLSARGVPVVSTREPGGTPLGARIREIVLSGLSDPWAEALLFCADRAAHAAEVIGPALSRGAWVVSDRFCDATLAYQGYGRGLPVAELRAVHRASTGGLLPDLTVLLDCDPETARARRRLRGGAPPDAFETEEGGFQERVRAGYLSCAREEPGRFVVLDASRDLPEVLSQMEARVLPRLWGWLSGAAEGEEPRGVG